MPRRGKACAQIVTPWGRYPPGVVTPWGRYPLAADGATLAAGVGGVCSAWAWR